MPASSWRRPTIAAPRRISTALFALTLYWTAAAQSANEPAIPDLHWKLTLGEYAYSGYAGTDANLRWRANDTSAWLGVYTDQAFGTQARGGADTSVNLGQYVQLQPSFQLASRGFVGGSVNVQMGGPWYAVVGLGRTDARPYFNLNFDPNDAVTLGVGHQSDTSASYTVFVVADNRFHTQQRDWHANVKIPVGNTHGTFDLLRKSGLSDVGYIKAWGFSANWDWPGWFARVAYDPYQNFSAQNAWRLAGGVRF
ncbi:MAG TPA: hypothetical protein VNO35_26540 [Steroidobacteraceae bacterium]|nr:hypothetical protein [Steroidobacteraceae bacterium]